jgi:hypothetical protein
MSWFRIDKRFPADQCQIEGFTPGRRCRGNLLVSDDGVLQDECFILGFQVDKRAECCENGSTHGMDPSIGAFQRKERVL